MNMLCFNVAVSTLVLLLFTILCVIITILATPQRMSSLIFSLIVAISIIEWFDTAAA